MCPACYSFQEMKIFHPLALTAFCCDIAFSSASCALKSETIQCVNMFGEAGWLSGWGTVLVILGSSPLPCLSLDLFLVASSSTPLLHFVYSQLDCLLPIGNLEYFVYVCLQCLFTICLN